MDGTFPPDAAFSSLERAYRSDGVQKLGDLAKVEVGIVTGRNSFFVIDDEQARNVRLNGFSQPLVGRTSSLRSICFNKKDFTAHSEKHPSILIDLNGVPEEELSGELVKYIQEGERASVHNGYKCSIRKRCMMCRQSTCLTHFYSAKSTTPLCWSQTRPGRLRQTPFTAFAFTVK